MASEGKILKKGGNLKKNDIVTIADKNKMRRYGVRMDEEYMT